MVVSESRQIVFSHDVLRAALVELERRRLFTPPPGAIVACELTENRTVPAKLTFHDVLADETHKVEVDHSKLAVALIQYCRKQKIPVPKTAAKHLKLEDGKISLNFSLSRNCD